MRVLLVEDDAKFATVLSRGLTEEGIVVERASTATAGLEHLARGGFDVCLLDVQLPDRDGFALLEEARNTGLQTPVLMLTARDAVPDRVRGLMLGADDYLTKPFAFAELLARLHALVRRVAQPLPSARLRFDDIELDPVGHVVTRGGARISLSRSQFRLLEHFMRHQTEVVSRESILQEVFGYKFDPGTNVVEVHVAHLRQKIDAGRTPSVIETVRGHGYRLLRSDDT